MKAMSLSSVFWLVVLLIHSSMLAFGEGEIKCIESERRALLRIKEELVDHYGRLSSWGSEDDQRECCEWEGIKCNNVTGHVITLNLHSAEYPYYLRGKISRSLAELQHLQVLDLSYNYFSDNQILEFIGSLRSLRSLNLSTAGFAGRLPSQVGNLSNLQYLNLGWNGFSNVGNDLHWLTHLSSLTHLDLSGVNLSKACDWSHLPIQLPSLKTLMLQACNLQDVDPSSLPFINSSASSLVSLGLHGNNFSSSIFDWLFAIGTGLEYLDLSGNPLRCHIPESFGQIMVSLENLHLESCFLEGGIPESMGNICTLSNLSLSYNHLSGQLPEIIYNLSHCAKTSLKGLNLGYNQFSGSFQDITEFSSLTGSYLYGNQLNGSFPTMFTRTIWDLKYLYFPGNQLTGSLPNYLSLSFPSLEMLYLGDNRLTGIAPNSISNLLHLTHFSIRNNSLKGIISEVHMSNLSSLKYLDLSINFDLHLRINSKWIPPFQLRFLGLRSCKLGPNFPYWIHSQRNISFIDISNTGISGNIPIWLTKTSPRLSYLNLCCNYLEGLLPSFPSNTTSLNLSKNRFHGSVSTLCDIQGGVMDFLDLSDNQLSGEIPECVMLWQELSILNLANNNFSSKISSSIGNMSQLTVLDLHNNSLFGELPSSMKNCKWLIMIDLSDNKLSGKIPHWIGESLPDLEFLILRSNDFHGHVPVNLCQLHHMKVLDLSSNYISGSIPQCFNNISMMTQSEIFWIQLDFGLWHMMKIDDTISYRGYYAGNVMIILKGKEDVYGRNLWLLRMIDLSSNKLTGTIPNSLTYLSELMHLNLSRNSLTGAIPQNIGNVTKLESLDISRNYLSGEIPSSMSTLHFLSHLNLSYNNLSGKIPTGTQLDGFTSSSYAGNPALCGPPMSQKCPGEGTRSQNQLDGSVGGGDKDEFEKWFFAGMGLGFPVGFWGICGPLMLNRSWRHAYFMFFTNLKDQLYVSVLVHFRRLQRRFHG